MPRRWARRALTALAWQCAWTALPVPKADAVADFYRGKTMTLVVGYGPGGGYDVYARLVGRHLGRHIPGHPTVVVQNMPGAGIAARRQLALQSGAEGRHRDRALRPQHAADRACSAPIRNAQFDPRKFTWLGSSSSFANDAYILIVRTDIPVKTIDDARRPGGEPLVLGGTAGRRDRQRRADHPARHHRAQRQAGRRLSRQRRDVPRDGARRGARPHHRPLRRSRRSSRNGSSRAAASRCWCSSRARRAHQDFPNVPTARELARNESRALLIELTELPYKLSRPFAAPPGVPAARARRCSAPSPPPTRIRNISPTPPSSAST